MTASTMTEPTNITTSSTIHMPEEPYSASGSATSTVEGGDWEGLQGQFSITASWSQSMQLTLRSSSQLCPNTYSFWWWQPMPAQQIQLWSSTSSLLLKKNGIGLRQCYGFHLRVKPVPLIVNGEKRDAACVPWMLKQGQGKESQLFIQVQREVLAHSLLQCSLSLAYQSKGSKVDGSEWSMYICWVVLLLHNSRSPILKLDSFVKQQSLYLVSKGTTTLWEP